MSDLNDLSRPVTTDTEPNVLDTLRAHIVRAATWSGWGSTANKVAGIMSSVTAAVSGGRSLRLYRRNDGNTADEEVVSLPGISVGGNAGTASAAQSGSTLRTEIDAKAPLNSPSFQGTPTVPTAAAGTNSLQVANTAFVQAAVANVVGSTPAALDTLNELAAALGNDANFAATTNAALANRIVKTSTARPGVTRLYRNDSDDAYNVQINWTGSYWHMRGYLDATYHAGVMVDYASSAASASSVPWSGVSGRPTLVSAFTNDAGYITSVPAPTTANVLSATAGASHLAVGTYWVFVIAVATNLASGQTIAGSSLRYGSANIGLGNYGGNPGYTGGGSAPPGTWMKMACGGTYSTSGSDPVYYNFGQALYLRVV